MEKNKTAKGITFGREDSFSNGKISNQYVYYNNNYVGFIRKTYVLNKKTGSYYDHIYNKHVFISTTLTEAQTNKIGNPYLYYMLEDLENYSLLLNLQNESESLELVDVAKSIYDVLYGENENNFINEINRLISKYSPFIDFKCDFNYGEENTVIFKLKKDKD